MRRFVTFLCFLSFTSFLQAQELTPAELLNRSIAFHDPDRNWENSKLEFVIKMESPDLALRTSRVIIDNEKGDFDLSIISQGRVIDYKVDGLDSCEVRIDYLPPTQEEADSLNLTPERARRWRDYYGYLYGLPMKLKDKGTVIGPEVIETMFQEEEVLALKVNYEENVGKDVWYFYFHPGTYAMVGYRFYHDESINDGEYIVLSGIEIDKGIRIPKDRAWYTNAENKLLGTDIMQAMEVTRYY